jgi:hypothetical protein
MLTFLAGMNQQVLRLTMENQSKPIKSRRKYKNSMEICQKQFFDIGASGICQQTVEVDVPFETCSRSCSAPRVEDDKTENNSSI